ncbi:MAG TPA: MarR family transcriptional regulator [Alphaproteobacteria bacterium]|nr:MarR family transcriptional regulator [Alphaproteobacteria bacterium]
MSESRRTPSDINGLYDHAGYWLNRLQAEMHGQLERRLSTHGVTAAQWGVLIGLYQGTSQTVRGLASFLSVDGGAVTRLIDRLESKGLVQRRVDRADRRSVILSLSEAGEALIPPLVQAVDEHDAASLGGLTAAERRQFLAMLSRLLMAQGIEPGGRPFADGAAPKQEAKPEAPAAPIEAAKSGKKEKLKPDKKEKKKSKKDKKPKADKKKKAKKKKGKK